jgi:hypothetical protein
VRLDATDFAIKVDQSGRRGVPPLKSRQLRLEELNLVKAPLMCHMEKRSTTYYYYDIKNQWCMSDKPLISIFNTQDTFNALAPTLNKRDKQDEEKGAMVGARDMPTINSYVYACCEVDLRVP